MRTSRALLAAVAASSLLLACGGEDDDEPAPSPDAEEATTSVVGDETTTVAEEETTTTAGDGSAAIADPDDDADGDGVLDPFCGESDYGGGLVLQIHCLTEGYASEVPPGVTLVEGSLFGLRSSIHRNLDGISGNLIVSRDPSGARVAVLVFQSDALFESGSAELLQPDTFDNVIGFVAGNFPGSAIQVRGHTDSVGDPASNQALAEQRAAAVQAHLLAGGVDASEVTAVGFGEAQPMALEDTPEGQALNRRVEVVIRPPSG